MRLRLGLRIALALAIFLIPSLSWGGAASKLRGVMSASCYAPTGTATTLNGYSAVDTGEGVYDTGVATPSAKPVCSGTASIVAICDGTAGITTVSLKINGAVVQTLSCALGTVDLTGTTLSWPVTGIYTAQVVIVGAGDAYADSFSFPVAQ